MNRPTTSKKVFVPYTDVPSKLNPHLWWIPRILVLLFSIYVVYLLVTQPEQGLSLFWKVLIPLLPAVFAFIPGLWRTICPMAFLNQIPRQLKFSKEMTLSISARKIALLVSFTGFFVFISMRHPLLNYSGLAVATLAIAVLVFAFIGGVVYKGRSGWCGTFCPLAPIQKIYGHAPLIMVKNSYCEPCLGCQNNCYDFNPNAAMFSDVYDKDPWWSDKRRYFAAALPGLIIGFFNAEMPASYGLVNYYSSIIVPIFISIGAFQTLYNFTRLSGYKVVAAFSFISLTLFYWYALPIFASGLYEVFNFHVVDEFVLVARLIILGLSLFVLAKGLRHEYLYIQTENAKVSSSVGKGLKNLQQAAKHVASNKGKITEQSSGQSFDIEEDESLLDAIETAGLPIVSGCRMGSCGADPVVITEGYNNLLPPSEDELDTLRRIGLEGKARLACCCKATGDVSIDLSKKPEDVEVSAVESSESEQQLNDKKQFKIVIVGNGISGISCAETLRKLDENCKIDIVTQEAFHAYNRIALEKMIHGRTGMDGLYLFKEEWYKKKNISVWLNTQVTDISTNDKEISLGTGEKLAYDKLVLATGASAFQPPIKGSELAGCFVLREAQDALNLRAWVQTHQCQHAVVLGGGVLGVEAADAIRRVGLKVTIVELGPHLMGRQIDDKAGEILSGYLANLGIQSRYQSGIEYVSGEDRLSQVVLKGGEKLDADILLSCAGIRSNLNLANKIGLEINRGVIVNPQLQSSHEDIYAVGDVAELPGALGGLWGVGNEQGKVAAHNILGTEKFYQPDAPPPIQLKVNGIDLRSFGRIQPNDEQNESLVHYENINQHQWLTILIKDSEILGGVFVNCADDANQAMLCGKKNDNAAKLINDIMNRTS